MTTYLEKSTELAREACVAVLVLANEQYDDVEFLPLKPRVLTDSDITDLLIRWPGRGLRAVGVMGLVGATPRLELKDPIEPRALPLLTGAFGHYLSALFNDSFDAQRETVEVHELCKLWALDDPRLAS